MNLAPWQHQFVEDLVERSAPKSLLVAQGGTGKTSVAQMAAARLLECRRVDRLLYVAHQRSLIEQFMLGRRAFNQPALGQAGSELECGTYSALRHRGSRLPKLGLDGSRWFAILDDIDWAVDDAERIADYVLGQRPGSLILFTSRTAPTIQTDATYRFDTEVFSGAVINELVSQVRIRNFSPSIPIIQQVQRRILRLDELSWREFEKLMADLLETEGYEVELMRGTKDDGVDIVAKKKVGSVGLIKSVWQAKKNRIDRKVGLSVVRELADTRRELGASKGVIVTTSYLTRGALDRIERDRYILGKMDRDDLSSWAGNLGLSESQIRNAD